MTTEVIDSFVEVPGGEIFVRCWNVEGGELAPIVLLHDSLGCVDLWRDFPVDLATAALKNFRAASPAK